MAVNKLKANDLQVLASLLLQRDRVAARLGKSFNNNRKLYEVCGYKKELEYTDYLAKYDRQDIAARIVDAPPAITWKVAPIVKEDDNEDNTTQFEESWDLLVKRMRVFHYLERIDKLSGIGRFGILLIGVKGGKPLNTPLENGSLKDQKDIIYLKPFSEGYVDIVEWETDPSNERFGKPKMYEVDLSSDLANAKFSIGKTRVHYTRVIHIAENLLEDEVFGEPRLKKVFNRLEDLEKIAAGGAEMFWQGAYGGLHADVRDGWQFQREDLDRLDEKLQEYVHGLRRLIQTEGMTLNRIGADFGDPKNIFDVIISLISGKTRIPKRILLGSERGELASSQDENNWFGYIQERRANHAEPNILRAFIDWCIDKGALPEPQGENDKYQIEWPPLYEMSDVERADLASKYATAIKTYSGQNGSEMLVPPAEFRKKFMNLDAEPDEEFKLLMEETEEEDLEKEEEQFQREFEHKKQNVKEFGNPAEKKNPFVKANDFFVNWLEANFNPYHDKDGKFASKGSGGAGNTESTFGNFKSTISAETALNKKYHDKTFNFDGADIETINPTIGEFDRLASKFPETAKSMKSITVKSDLYLDIKKNSGQGMYAGMNDKGEMYLNSKYYGRPEAFKTMLANDVKSGWHPKGGDKVESLLTHEFAHHIANTIQSSGSQEAKFKLSQLQGKLANTTNAAKISKYATKNYSEAFAEAFVAYEHGGVKTGLPKQVGEFVYKYAK